MLPCGENGRSMACIEVGSEKCPCFLAIIKRCPVCTYLSAKGCSDCQWAGVCILLESGWASNDVENHNLKEFVGKINALRYLGPNALYVQISTITPILLDPRSLGTYFMIEEPVLHRPFAPAFLCNLTDHGRNLELVISSSSLGAREALSLKKRSIRFHGPFTGTIIGEKAFQGLSGGTALLIGEGFYQGAMVLTARSLLERGNRVKAIIAGGKARRPYILNLLKKEGTDVLWAGNSNKDASLRANGILATGGIDLVFSCGSFLHHAKVICSLKKQRGKEIIPVFLSPLPLSRKGMGRKSICSGSD